MSRADRVADAAGQLCRYSGEPHDDEFCDALDALADLNDDICNMRAIELCQQQADKVKAAVDAIMAKQRRRL